jgi:hypothetical protein
MSIRIMFAEILAIIGSSVPIDLLQKSVSSGLAH